jgi:hypothetical protein
MISIYNEFFLFSFSFNSTDIEPGTVDIYNTDFDNDDDVILESITYL